MLGIAEEICQHSTGDQERIWIIFLFYLIFGIFVASFDFRDDNEMYMGDGLIHQLPPKTT